MTRHNAQDALLDGFTDAEPRSGANTRSEAHTGAERSARNRAECLANAETIPASYRTLAARAAAEGNDALARSMIAKASEARRYWTAEARKG